MNDETPRLTPETLERLIERAMELDEHRNVTIAPAHAREIAIELGIDAAAWDAAMLEHARSRPAPAAVTLTPQGVSQAILSAIGGLGAGGVMGAVSAASTGDDIVAGGALIAASLGLAIRQALHRPRHDAQASIAGWWSAAAAGIMLGEGQLTGDVLWFAGISWLGCATIAAVIPDLLGRAPRPPRAADTRPDDEPLPSSR